MMKQSSAGTKQEHKAVRKYSKRNYQAFLYLLPWLIGLFGLQLFPLFRSLYQSFTEFTVGGTPTWVGLDNYVRLFTKDREFWNSLRVTLLYTFVTVPLKVTLALLIALFLNRSIKGINLIRTVYYIPSLFGGSVAISILWRLLFLENGTINSFLQTVGLQKVSWLGNPNIALWVICALEIWMFGSSMIMFLAALKNVPASYMEAAELDGASRFRKFFSITLPQITPVLFFTLINQTVQAMQNYTSAAIVTNGGPMKATYVLGMKLYREGFTYFRMGYASSLAWVVFVIIVVLTMFLFRSSSAWVYYGDEGDR